MPNLNNLIVFPHCPKTGGTTLKERYRYNNDSFIVTDLGKNVSQNTQVVFGHTAEIGYYESQFPNKNIVYMTCLRHPIDRIMSMYNFYKTQLLYLNPNTSIPDFYLWFINKDVIRPMRVLKQYEYYLYQHVEHINWADKNILADTNNLNYMYTNNVFTWNVLEDASYVDKDKVEQYTKQQNDIEQQNMDVAWHRVIKDFDHVFFQDDNIVNTFDDLLNKYELEMTPWKEMVITNETIYDLKKNNLKYITFEELDSDLQHIVNIDLKYDIEFYNRCKEKWKL